MTVRDELKASLISSREYRHAYSEEILNLFVCTQIRVLREQRDMTQAQLAEALGTAQAAVSRIENVDYSAWNISTLRRLAEVFDLRLKISFEGFSSLWRDIQSLNRVELQRDGIESDPEFADPEPETTTAIDTAGTCDSASEGFDGMAVCQTVRSGPPSAHRQL